MSHYDGMGTMWQSSTPIFYSAYRPNKNKYTFRLSQLWGQCQVFLLLFLFISPVYTKPLKSSNFLSPEDSEDSQQTKQKSEFHNQGKSAFKSEQNQLTQERADKLGKGSQQQQQPTVNYLPNLSNSVNLVKDSQEVTTTSSVNSDSYNYHRFYIKNVFSNEFINALRAIDHDLIDNSVEESNKLENNNLIESDNTNILSNQKNLKNIWRKSNLDHKSTHLEVPHPSVSTKILQQSSQNLKTVESISPTISGLESPKTTIVSRVTRNTAEPGTIAVNPGMMDVPDQANGGGRNNEPHWSLPCKVDDSPNPQSTPSYLASHIFNSVNVAHKHAHRFKNAFASQLWDGMDWDVSLSMVNSAPFDFINRLSIPDDELLRSTPFNTVLSVAYESMQRRAVSIEQVTLDQALYRDLNDTDFLSEFRAIEGEIVSVLCELHYAMKQQNVHTTVEITAEIMEEKYRDVDSSSGRLSRDTIILREYLNGLDYLMAVFGYFKNQAP